MIDWSLHLNTHTNLVWAVRHASEVAIKIINRISVLYVYSNENLKKVTINFGTYIINKSKRAFLVNNIRTYILYMIMKWYIVAQIFLM